MPSNHFHQTQHARTHPQLPTKKNESDGGNLITNSIHITHRIGEVKSFKKKTQGTRKADLHAHNFSTVRHSQVKNVFNCLKEKWCKRGKTTLKSTSLFLYLATVNYNNASYPREKNCLHFVSWLTNFQRPPSINHISQVPNKEHTRDFLGRESGYAVHISKPKSRPQAGQVLGSLISF